MPGFATATALSPDGDGFGGAFDRDWWGGVGPHGGYLAAIMVRAALLAGEPRQQLRSLTLHYLESAREGHYRVEARRLRATRSSSTLELRLRQGEKLILAGIAGMGKARSCPDLTGATMPAASGYEETDVSPFLGGSATAPPFATRLEYRHCLGPEPLSGSTEALTGGWLRLLDGHPVDMPAAAMLMDAWWPAIWSRLRRLPRMPSLDLTVHFRRPLPDADEPVLARFRSRLALDGFADEEGELWSADGRLLVQSRQLQALLVPPE
jgi:acyl-CoA thioesterase